MRLTPEDLNLNDYVIIVKEGEKRATCEVDGKVYLDGEYFNPKSDPNLDCYCMPGYTGTKI